MLGSASMISAVLVTQKRKLPISKHQLFSGRFKQKRGKAVACISASNKVKEKVDEDEESEGTIGPYKSNPGSGEYSKRASTKTQSSLFWIILFCQIQPVCCPGGHIFEFCRQAAESACIATRALSKPTNAFFQTTLLLQMFCSFLYILISKRYNRRGPLILLVSFTLAICGLLISLLAIVCQSEIKFIAECDRMSSLYFSYATLMCFWGVYETKSFDPVRKFLSLTSILSAALSSFCSTVSLFVTHPILTSMSIFLNCLSLGKTLCSLSLDIGWFQHFWGNEDSLEWELRATLRSHLDEIRAMQFHPVEPILFTASEDGTIKMWDLEAPKKDDKHEGIEPIYTFRGHQGPVLCMDLSPTGDNMFTGGFDGVVCCWNMLSIAIEQHEEYDARVLSERLRGHADIVWSVAYHSSDNRLVSASSDGTLKLWEPGNFIEPLLRTIDPPENDIVPTSVDFVSAEPNQLLVAYTHSIAKILDIDNGTVLLNFDFGEENTGVIARILSHPTMAITIVAGDDRKIRYLDNTTGKVIQRSVAHSQGISCLAVDPNGQYLLSGSHDGSLRLWNTEKKICLQEISAHRKKYDASVTCVAFHPSRPLIGSAGADALAKVFSNVSD